MFHESISPSMHISRCSFRLYQHFVDLLVEFLEIGFVVVKQMTHELHFGISGFESGSNKNFKSIQLKLWEIELLNIENGNSFIFLLLLMEISRIVNWALINYFELLVFHFFFYLFYRSLCVCVMDVNEVRFVEVWNCRVEWLFMETGLTCSTP